VPEALIAFLESDSYEEAIRNAISLVDETVVERTNRHASTRCLAGVDPRR
jgi:hypothetical protein